MRLTRNEFRGVMMLLLLLIGAGLVIGVTALFFPSYFYQHFLLGADWMPMLGSYSQEMTQVAGALYLGMTVPAVIALVRPAPRLLIAVGWANAFAAFPHMVYHLSMEYKSGFFQTIPQAGFLFATIVAGIATAEIARTGQHRYFATRHADEGQQRLVFRDEGAMKPARARAVRRLLGLLSLGYLAFAVYGLFFPYHFYRDSFFGLDWISRLGDYSQHLTFDTGALCAGFAAAMVLAATWLTPDVSRAFGLGTAAAALPMVIYHIAELNNEGALAAAVQASAFFLVLLTGLILTSLARPAVAQAGSEIAPSRAAAASPPARQV
jgi:hypothetical protein